ncbi:MAG: hypothetical protein ACPGWR_01290 [Ardenticatenaceae bacterium]
MTQMPEYFHEQAGEAQVLPRMNKLPRRRFYLKMNKQARRKFYPCLPLKRV